MRNILEYPVTLEEKLQLLDRLIDEFNAKGLIGDMRAYLLHEIRDDVVAANPSE